MDSTSLTTAPRDQGLEIEMSNITARKTENDGRQWFAVTVREDYCGLEAGEHVFGIAEDGSLIDDEGYPVKHNEYQRRAVEAACAAAA
jgi:hypothetical protein